MNPLTHTAITPWYREPWPWFLISLPATAVIAGLTTVWIAAKSADGLVVGDYYKAGLAINQTLARDDVARDLELHAALRVEDGMLALTLDGRLPAYPAQLALVLAHPTRQGQDQLLTLEHTGGGRYQARFPALADGKWHALLSDAAATWRLSGVLHTPLGETVALTTGAASPVLSEGD